MVDMVTEGCKREVRYNVRPESQPFRQVRYNAQQATDVRPAHPHPGKLAAARSQTMLPRAVLHASELSRGLVTGRGRRGRCSLLPLLRRHLQLRLELLQACV